MMTTHHTSRASVMTARAKKGLIGLALLILVGAGAYWGTAWYRAVSAPPIQTGFFNPEGVDAYAAYFPVSIINLVTLEHLRVQLDMARKHGHKVYVDLSSTIASPRPPEAMAPVILAGQPYTKALPPQKENKLRDFLPPEAFDVFIDDLNGVVSEYQDVVEGYMVIDEPYLNGVTRHSLEMAATRIRQLLQRRNLDTIKLGLTFAGAMFNAGFARHVNGRAMEYAQGIDRHLAREVPPEEMAEHQAWVDRITKYRLTTYDVAGHMYTGGGLPAGYDLYGLDFYISTLLHDQNYAHVPGVLADLTGNAHCRTLPRDMATVKARLSFFGAQDVAPEDEKALLDELYLCRFQAALELLRSENTLAGGRATLFAVTESSNVGLLDYDLHGNRLPEQDNARSEARMEDEMARARFLRTPGLGISKVFWFPYSSTYDPSIRLAIGGVDGHPELMTTAREVQRHLSGWSAWLP